MKDVNNILISWHRCYYACTADRRCEKGACQLQYLVCQQLLLGIGGLPLKSHVRKKRHRPRSCVGVFPVWREWQDARERADHALVSRVCRMYYFVVATPPKQTRVQGDATLYVTSHTNTQAQIDADAHI